MQNSLPNTPAQGREFRLPRPMTALGLLGCLFLFCLVVAGVLLPFLPRLVSRPEAAVACRRYLPPLEIRSGGAGNINLFSPGDELDYRME